mgnify:FL=1
MVAIAALHDITCAIMIGIGQLGCVDLSSGDTTERQSEEEKDRFVEHF